MRFMIWPATVPVCTDEFAERRALMANMIFCA